MVLLPGSTDEVLEQTDKLNSNKLPRPNGINPGVLKGLKNEVPELLTTQMYGLRGSGELKSDSLCTYF